MKNGFAKLFFISIASKNPILPSLRGKIVKSLKVELPIIKMKKYKVIGLMSGSSLDGVDIAYCHFQVERKEGGIIVHDWSLQVAETIAFPERWYNRLYNLPTQNALIFAKTHTYFGHFLGECVLDFVKNHQVQPDLIASHGHTVFHEPHNRMTIQIGDGAALAATTGYTVVNNFRNQDVAINGEGAPVAPIADKYLFAGHDFYLNLGGIANISCLLPNSIKGLSFNNLILNPWIITGYIPIYFL